MDESFFKKSIRGNAILAAQVHPLLPNSSRQHQQDNDFRFQTRAANVRLGIILQQKAKRTCRRNTHNLLEHSNDWRFQRIGSCWKESKNEVEGCWKWNESLCGQLKYHINTVVAQGYIMWNRKNKHQTYIEGPSLPYWNEGFQRTLHLLSRYLLPNSWSIKVRHC